MKLPESVTILGKRYRIVSSQVLMEQDEAHGKCQSSKCLIQVDVTADIQQVRDTLLHEAMHAMYSEIGLSEDLKEDDEEKIVRRLSTILLSVLRYNPKFTRFLLRGSSNAA